MLLSKSGRSQRWLAEQSGLNLSTLNLIISGERECARSHLRALCAAFSDPKEKMGVAVAALQDELIASGVDATRVLIRHVDGVDLENLHLQPAFNAYLGVIARRLLHEAKSGDKLISDQVEWLSGAVARIEALEADAQIYEFPRVDQVAEDQAPYDAGAAPTPPKPKKP